MRQHRDDRASPGFTVASASQVLSRFPGLAAVLSIARVREPAAVLIKGRLDVAKN